MSFSRKIKRNKNKVFKKSYKKTMSKWKRSVVCGECGRPPRADEKIDNWTISKTEEKMKLMCIECNNLDDEANNE